MKKKMTVVIVSVLSVLVFILIAGFLLPSQRKFVKETVLKSAPEAVFQLVADVKNQVNWRTDVQEIRVIDEKNWTEVPKKGTPITFRVKQKVEPQRFEIEIVEPQNFKGYWVGTFEPVQGGTRVVFQEVVVVDNPLFRLLSFLFVDLDQTMETYLHDLKTALGE